MPGPGPVSEQGDGRSYGRIGDVPRTAVTVVMDMTAMALVMFRRREKLGN